MDFKKIEQKWQKKWEEEKIFQVRENSKKKKFYIVEMFPYPSGEGLHIGHAFNFTIADMYARFKRMQGFNVLYPIGYDSLGLPAENAAIKVGIHPKKYINNAISNFMKQQRLLGFSYDWSRVLMSHDPSFYKWDQWIFLKLFEKGLAFRKKAAVNWCSSCKTVLANEQAQGGICDRCKTKVELKQLEQWFFRITDYADELYEGIDKLPNWPASTKAMQKNWIGKSHGIEINFKINNEDWLIFTTRPDTLFGVTFVVVSAQHPRLMELVTTAQKKEVDNFLKKIKSTSEKDMGDLEKEGAFTGSYAINPITNEKVPVYTGNFVVADYGSGMVMAVPAHDQRDFEFAKKYKIPIKIVIQNKTKDLDAAKLSSAYTEEGTLVNSKQFNEVNSQEAIAKISDHLEKNKLGKRKVLFKLRDWLISRQRYWGTPIPIVYCDKCGIVPVPEKELPIELPEKVTFGEGNPLATNAAFVNTKCPKCKGKARRETDTMDTFVNSSWYFYRYADPKNSKKLFDTKKTAYWMPLDFYIGGAEHACMHLIYCRFYTKFFRDMGMTKLNEPVPHLFHQGMVHGEDGYVMSKSRGNGLDPLDIIAKYSADTLRMFLVSIASPDSDYAWSSTGIESTHKFIQKVYDYVINVKIGKSSKKLESKVNQIIRGITADIDNLKYNLAIIKLKSLFEVLSEEQEVAKKDLEKFIKLLSPFCPHITEELWATFSNKSFISTAKWPTADESKINKTFEEQEKTIEIVVSDVVNIIKIVKEKQNKDLTKVYLYVIPKEIDTYDTQLLKKKIGKEITVFAVNDKNKYDPEGKSSKAKPGKPGIYVE